MKLKLQKLIAKTLMLGLLINAFLPMALLAEDNKSCLSHLCNPKPEKCKNKFFKTVDYIIVGAGTAGLPCAWALTNDNTTSVLVLEAGEDLTSDPLVLSPNVFAFFDPVTYNPKYAGIHVTTNNTQRVIYSRGAMIGGSSAHNYLQAMRGTPDIYNEWAALTGNPAWSYANLLPLFISQEHYIPNGNIPDTTQRGLDGRLYISQQDPLTGAFTAAVAEAFNVPIAPAPGNNYTYDYNDHFLVSPGVYANQVGVYPNQQFTTEYCAANTCGTRSFSGNSYLTGITTAEGANPAVLPIVDANLNGINGRKLYVRTSTTVSRILFEGTKAIGVEIIVNKGKKQKVMRSKARKGVILSAGSVMNPAILQRSGIGKASDLIPLGIDVLIDNPNVGYNGQNQYGVDNLILKKSFLNPLSIPTCWNDIGVGDGVRRCLVNLITGALVPSIVLGVLGLNPGEVFADYVDILSFLLAPKSRSSVVIQSTDPLTPPYVDLNMFSDTDGPGGTSQDLADCVALFKLGQDVATAQNGGVLDPAAIIYPVNAHYPAPWGPAPDDSLLENDAKLNPHFSDHLCSTCQMAPTAATGVVDGNLKVFGTDHLYIADDSIQPIITKGSTAYPAYFIGLQLAKFLGAILP